MDMKESIEKGYRGFFMNPDGDKVLKYSLGACTILTDTGSEIDCYTPSTKGITAMLYSGDSISEDEMDSWKRISGEDFLPWWRKACEAKFERYAEFYELFPSNEKADEIAEWEAGV